MEETTPTIEEKTPTIEEKTPKIEEKPPKIEATVAKTESEEKKKGRPAGAKDKAPRKKKIVIVEEPIHVPVPREPRQKAAEPPEVPRPVPVPEPEPPSPRTIYRAATRHVMHAQNQKIDARRTQIQQTYTQKLHTF